MNRQSINSNTVLYTFDSINEVLDFTNEKHYVNRDAGFVGAELPTWESAKKRFDEAAEKDLSVIDEFVERIKAMDLPEPVDHVRRVRFTDDDGYEIDYDRLMAGQEFWRKCERQETSGPTEITIFSDLSASAAYSSEDLLWRGAAALAITEILEERGFRVELWLVEGTEQYGHKNVINSLCLKRCSDPVDRSSLVNAVSSWFYRSTMFTTYLTQVNDDLNGPSTDNVGRMKIPTQVELDNISRDPNRIYVSGTYSFHSTMDLVERILKEYSPAE